MGPSTERVGNAQEVILRLLKLLGLGRQHEQQGYYAKHRHLYRPPPEVQRLVDSSRECQRVHKLSSRTPLQWVGSMAALVGLGGAIFVLVAIVKEDEKFHRTV